MRRMVGDVDALQGLYLRGLGPPLVALVVALACVVATAFVLPAAAIVLAVGLALAGIAVPLLAAATRAPRRCPPGGGSRGADRRSRRAPARRSGARRLRPRGRRARARSRGRSRAPAPRPPRCARLRDRRRADDPGGGPDDGRRPRTGRHCDTTKPRSIACSSRRSRFSRSPRSTPSRRSRLQRASSPRRSRPDDACSSSRSASRR